MYFDTPVEGTELRATGDVSTRVVLSLNAVGLLVLGLAWGPLFAWCQRAFGIHG